MSVDQKLDGYRRPGRCPDCHHFTGNHGLRGCYAGACKCPRTCCQLDHPPAKAKR